MNGVEILAFEEVACAWESWSWSSFWIGIAIGLVVSLIAGFVAVCQEDSVGAGLFVFGVIFIVAGLIIGVTAAKTLVDPIEYETQYKVTIDKTVSMTEFNEKYEVIEQDGKIYTVRERTEPND